MGKSSEKRVMHQVRVGDFRAGGHLRQRSGVRRDQERPVLWKTGAVGITLEGPWCRAGRLRGDRRSRPLKSERGRFLRRMRRCLRPAARCRRTPADRMVSHRVPGLVRKSPCRQKCRSLSGRMQWHARYFGAAKGAGSSSNSTFASEYTRTCGWTRHPF